MAEQAALLAGAGQRSPRRLRLALAACALVAVTVCLVLARSPRTPTQLLTRCTHEGCAQEGGVKTRTSQLQLASHSARGRSATLDVGVLGRVGKVGKSHAPRREVYKMPDVGLLGRVEAIGHAQTPSLKSWNIGHSFEGSGTGPKWENGRTAVIGHHANDPKIIEDASDVIAHDSSNEHDKYYYDNDHDNNGNLLEGGNEDAPDWWQKGKARQRRPYVTWGSRYADELEKDEHKDDTRLVNAGVNVESHRDFLPLPWSFDETEYDHDLQQGRDQPKSPYQFKLRDEASSRILREKGVTVSRDPFAAGGEQGAGDKIVVRRPCTYRYVDGVAGMQTHTPYFTDPNSLKSGKASRYKLEHEGVLLSSNLFDKAMPAPHLASYDPTRADGCDQGDSDHIVDFGDAEDHALPEGQLDVEVEPPHGTVHFVDVFSPDYEGPGKKYLPTTGDAQFK